MNRTVAFYFLRPFLTVINDYWDYFGLMSCVNLNLVSHNRHFSCQPAIVNDTGKISPMFGVITHRKRVGW